MKDLISCGIYHDVDFWDHEKLEKLQEKRALKWLNIYKKIKAAEEKKDEKALAKALKDMKAHDEVDNLLKQKAKQTGYFWW